MILFFYTALKPIGCPPEWWLVWWSFSFTLLSNNDNGVRTLSFVWWSFSFTLLSNNNLDNSCGNLFDDPFLLHCSQTLDSRRIQRIGLMILFFYTALKLCFWVWCANHGLMILFFYTALKPYLVLVFVVLCLMILFFYTALKQNDTEFMEKMVWWSFSFTLLSNQSPLYLIIDEFDDPFLLHCSQTTSMTCNGNSKFDDPFLLHCSQTYQ